MSGPAAILRWLGDRWVPLGFAAFCLAVLAANATMIAIAVATWPGLETADAFRKGVGYNAALAAAREQAGLGWWAELAATPRGGRRLRLELRLTDAAGRPVERAGVRADLVRPTLHGHDLTVGLERTAAAGTYATEAELPLPGFWDVRLRAEQGARLYRATRRVLVP